MLPVFVLGGAVLLVAGAASLVRKRDVNVGANPFSTIPSGLLRIRLRIAVPIQKTISRQAMGDMSPEGYLHAFLRRAICGRAITTVLVAAHDPTDPEIWSFIVKSVGGKALPESLGSHVRVESCERVATPDVDSRPFKHAELDEGLTNDDAHAILHALRKDDNPKHLGGFASVVDDEYPIAAGLLRAKARLATLRMAARRKGGISADMAPLVRAFRALDIPLEPYQDVFTSLAGYKTPFQPTASEPGAIERLRGMQTPEMIAQLHQALSLFTRKPDRLAVKDAEVASELKVSPISVAAAREMLILLPGLVLVVDPIKRKLVGPLTRKPLTMAALQLAHATRRPVLSRVTRPDALKNRFRQIGVGKQQGVEGAEEAQGLLDRADKALSRRQWVEWYKRMDKLPKSDGPPPGSLTKAFLR